MSLEVDAMVEGHTGVERPLVLFLGAGASAAVGYRTLLTFYDLFKDPRFEIEADVRRLLDAVISSLRFGGQPVNLENILWRFEHYINLGRSVHADYVLHAIVSQDPILKNDLRDFFRKVERARHKVEKIVIRHYGYLVKEDEGSDREKHTLHQLREFFEFYERIAVLNGGSLDIFTTNYDMFFEEMVGLGVLNYGVGPSQGDHSAFRLISGIDAESLSHLGWWEPEVYDRATSAHERVWRLFRLHGCVRWFIHEEAKSVSPDSQEFTRRVYYSPTGERKEESDQPCVMYPGRKLRIREAPFVTAYEHLEKALAQCVLCLVIGFNFMDHDILKLLLNASPRRKDKLRLVVVDLFDITDDITRRLNEVGIASPTQCIVPEVKLIQGPIESLSVQRRVLDWLGTILGGENHGRPKGSTQSEHQREEDLYIL